MSYAQFGTIQASDYNTLVGTNPNTSSGTLNTVWSTGGTAAGYGQTAEGTVAVGDTVTAAKWANLITKTANTAAHQGSSITAVTAPVSGNTITFLPFSAFISLKLPIPPVATHILSGKYKLDIIAVFSLSTTAIV